jgi:YD repeat-containing protein
VSGYGWSHGYEQHLIPAGADFDRFDGRTQRTDRYVWNFATQTFTSPTGFYDRLQAGAGGTYTITDRDGTVSTFSLIGGIYRMTQMRDRNQNTLLLAYTGDRLTSVTDSMNRTVTITYDANGRVAGLWDWVNPAVAAVQFGYSAAGDLISKTDALGFTKSYTYAENQPRPWQNHNLLTCSDRIGQVYVAVTYDEQTDRVVSERYGAAAQVYRFKYAPEAGIAERSIQMIDRRGMGTWQFACTAAGHVASRTLSGPEGSFGLTIFGYNAVGERTMEDRAGVGVRWVFDEMNADPLRRGNLLERRRVGTGGLPDRVESWTYLASAAWPLASSNQADRAASKSP